MRHVAFKCTWNDGGADAFTPGFAGRCSREQIEINTVDDKIWCGREENACWRWRESGYEGTGPGFPCYESRIRTHAEFALGMDFDTERARTARDLRRGSLCFLTTRRRTPYGREENRMIFGAFRVGEILGTHLTRDLYEGAYGVVVRGDPAELVVLPQDRWVPFWPTCWPDQKPQWKRNLFRYLEPGAAERALAQLWSAAPSPDLRRRVDALAAGLSVPLPPPGPDEVDSPWKEEVQRKYGPGGESIAHRTLKEWVAAHPEEVGLDPATRGQTEFRFPSADRADVVFFHPTQDRLVHVVEVELEGDAELRVGLFQAVKYRALARAVNTENGQPEEVGATLVALRVGRKSLDLAKEMGVMAAAKRAGKTTSSR